MAKKILYTSDVILRGITPLLQHKCGTIEKKATSAETNYDDEWLKTIYLGMGGNQDVLIAPALNIAAMMRDAAKGHKIGKTVMPKIICSGTDVVQFEVPIMYKGKIFTLKNIMNDKATFLYTCPAVVKKQRIMRTRAMIPPGWEISFSINVTSPLIKADILYDLFVRAGTEQGLMDWRPGSPKPGKFGQFEVIEFK